MERLRFRSTSLVDLQAELRQRDLLHEVDRVRTAATVRRRRRTFLGISIAFHPLPGRRTAR